VRPDLVAGPFQSAQAYFRVAYGHFLSRHMHIYGMWYFTPHAVLHLVPFGLLGFLASLVSVRWPIRGYAIAGVVVLGFAIELLQFRLHPGNSFESWDLRNDALGACLGALLAYAWSAKHRPSDATCSQ
jgi:glycopeptide antibiotics resistance protein